MFFRLASLQYAMVSYAVLNLSWWCIFGKPWEISSVLYAWNAPGCYGN